MGIKAKLCYTESMLMENRIGVVSICSLLWSPGESNPNSRLELLQEVRWPSQITVAGERGSIPRSPWRSTALSTLSVTLSRYQMRPTHDSSFLQHPARSPRC